MECTCRPLTRYNKLPHFHRRAKARQELEDLYLGVADNSVDLTFKDLASFQQEEIVKRKTNTLETIKEQQHEGQASKESKRLDKAPSLDFAKALQDAKDHHRRVEEQLSRSFSINKGSRSMFDGGQVYGDDISGFSTMATPLEERKRPGIPHSNICARCSDYIYVFRNRCLVCGRVYCRKCVGEGMGEMSEGRKCVDCLGRRFSQRYIQKAGETGCCWRYRSAVKLQELKWAEKGPRRSGERRYGKNNMASRPRSPAIPGTPNRPPRPSRPRTPVTPKSVVRSVDADNPSVSFVASSTFSISHHGFPL